MVQNWILSDVSLWTTVAVTIPLSAIAYLYFKKSTATTSCDIPWAPGKIPILGHALAYRKDPSGFLLQTCQTVGSIFQLNLAGKHMIIVAGTDAQRQISMAPERILSARRAVADIGFEETLGSLNVHRGTDLHKGIVKGIWQHDQGPEQSEGWKNSLERALKIETEIYTTPGNLKAEFFHLIRRVVLRSTIERMIGTGFLDSESVQPADDGDTKTSNNKDSDVFLKEFMAFQDELEDVTAKAVVLPRWFALPVLLWPVRRRRERLQVKIVQRLKEMLVAKRDEPNGKKETGNGTNSDRNNNNGCGRDKKIGFWLAQVYPEHPLEDIAEYIVGLLFAAHKNPAIGAAQAYLMLHEYGSDKDRTDAMRNARALLSLPHTDSNNNNNNNNNLLPVHSGAAAHDDDRDRSKPTTTLHRLCLETLRLTAHTIGAVRTVQEDFIIKVTTTASPSLETCDRATSTTSTSTTTTTSTSTTTTTSTTTSVSIIDGEKSNSDLNNETTVSYVIPKGASIGLTHIVPSLHPLSWGVKATDFDLQAHAIDAYQDEYKFTTFSHGLHKCPGQKLAVAVIMQYTVALLLQEYQIILPATIPPLSFERATLAQREAPVMAEIRKKQPSDSLLL